MIICKWKLERLHVSGKLKNCTRLPNTHTTQSTTHTLNFRTENSNLLSLTFSQIPKFPKPRTKIFIIFMDPHEQEALKFFPEFIRQETAARESGSESGSLPPSPPSITNLDRAKQAVAAVMDDDHILNLVPTVFCNFPVEQLEVLKESRVNFNNMAANKMDLRQDVAFQVSGHFFERLHGPIYEKIVKEFWKHATCDDHYIVSHVLGRKIVITEKLIARLLQLNHREGIVFAGKEKDMSDKDKNVLISYLYKGFKKGEFSYPLKSLLSELLARIRKP